MINVAEILKDVPKGTKLYSPIFGECVLSYIGTTAIKVTTANTFDGLIFDEYGRNFQMENVYFFHLKTRKVGIISLLRKRMISSLLIKLL